MRCLRTMLPFGKSMEWALTQSRRVFNRYAIVGC
jgi:hypothetical protein